MAIQSIDFSALKFNLKEISESRVLSQYRESPLFNLLLGAITSEVQELLDAIVEMMEYSTLEKAEGVQLDNIGKIIGVSRTSYEYDESYWFTTDEEGIGMDNGHWWVQGASFSTSSEMDDTTYRKYINMKIQKNHNLFSSTPELVKQFENGIGETIGIEITGMMVGKLYAQSEISLTNYTLLDYNKNTNLTDNSYLFAYPATTSISSKVKV